MKKQYKSNKLDKVIFRIDFENVELAHLGKFYEDVLKGHFPTKEEKKVFEVVAGIDVKSGKLTQEKAELLEWRFENTEKNKLFTVGSKWAFLEYSQYQNSVELINDISNVMSTFLNSFEIKTINRVGLRYINKIDLGKGNPLDWAKYINSDLLGNLDFAQKNKLNISRSMGQLVIKEDKYSLTFNFGLWNGDFPSEIVRREFILDYDCFSRLPSPAIETDIEQTAKDYNHKIQELFESSITDELRKQLNK